MKLSKQFGLPLAVTALGLCLSTSAQAISYAVAYQDIQNGSLTFSNFVNTTGGVLSGGTTTSTTSADFTGQTAQGDSETVPRGNIPPADADNASIGVVRTENLFNSFVTGGTVGNYSTADAQVISEQLNPGDTFSATNIAEYYISGTATAGSRGGNGSTTGFSLTFFIEGPGTVDFLFSFDNNPYMEAFLDTLGGSATANISAELKLDKVENGLQVGSLSWTPDGVNNNINAADVASIGATSATDVDPFDLTTSLSLLAPVGAPAVYNPTGGALGDNTFANWSLSILGMTHGIYTITLDMEERSRGNNIAVPEPGTLALLGLGLLGSLPFARRRRV